MVQILREVAIEAFVISNVFVWLTLLAMAANVVVDAMALVMTLDGLADAIITAWLLTALVLTIFNVETRENVAYQRKLTAIDDCLLNAATEHFR